MYSGGCYPEWIQKGDKVQLKGHSVFKFKERKMGFIKDVN